MKDVINAAAALKLSHYTVVNSWTRTEFKSHLSYESGLQHGWEMLSSISCKLKYVIQHFVPYKWLH